MKRENSGEGYAVMKKGHEEKRMDLVNECDLKYARGEMSNPEELKDNADKLASYVRNNRMKY